METTGTTLHGLSRDVTLAVLPRLYIEELVTELARRNLNFSGYSIKQEFLVGVLKDIMTQEYHSIEADEHPSDYVTDDKNVESMPDEELAQREQFQCQMLHSQTLSRICPSSDIESRLAAETMTQFQGERNICTKQESSSKVDNMWSEAFPEETASWNDNMLSVRAIEDDDHTESGSDRTESLTSVTTRPISLLDNISSPKAELEDSKTPNDEELYSNDSHFQINSRSSSNESNTSSIASDIIGYSCKDCGYLTNERSDLVKHTGSHSVSFDSGIKREEQDCTSQSHLLDTEQGMETPEVTAMIDPSNTVIAGTPMQSDLPMTDPVPENSGHIWASSDDEKAAQLCKNAYGDSGLYDTELDSGNTTQDNESDFQDFDDEKKSRSGNNSSTCLKSQDITLYTCKECGYWTKINKNFVRHTRIHTGEKSFMCPYCDYRAARRETLKTHMFQHSGKKPYQCSECGCTTTRKSQLLNHMRTHTREKPYKCDECGFKSATKGNLVKHMRKHTGEKPFMCDECGFRTAHSSSLNCHMKRHT